MLLISCSFERDYVHIVGSSSMYPIMTKISEDFAMQYSYKTPIIESIGTGAGINLFCSGMGTKHPDAVNSSRYITESEINRCKKNGINNINKIVVSKDSLILVAAKNNNIIPDDISLSELYDILSNVNRKKWKNTELDIYIYGPDSNSGNYEILLEKIINPLCKDSKVCNIRSDKVYIESSSNQNVVINKVVNSGNDSGSIAIIPSDFYESNKSSLKAIKINGLQYNNKAYPISRELLLYYKSDLSEKRKDFSNFIKYIRLRAEQ